jgi:hypothetical protein
MREKGRWGEEDETMGASRFGLVQVVHPVHLVHFVYESAMKPIAISGVFSPKPIACSL